MMIIETNDGVPTNENKQAQIFTDENQERMAVKSNYPIVTRSKATNTRNCPLRIPVGAATNNEGASINPPKLTSALRNLETNNGISTNKDKEQAQGFTDENNPHENQDTCDSFFSEKYASHGSHSFHFTEFVNQDPMDDNKEVESTIDQSLVFVGEYRVKKEIAPLLEKIILNHKDIAKECVIKNRQSHVPYLEMICATCQMLENACLNDISDIELEGMSILLKGIQHMGFDMKWLSERIQDISKAKNLVKEYPTLKEGSTKLEMKRKEFDTLNQKLSNVEFELLLMEMYVDQVDDDLNQRIEALKLEGLALWGNSLLYGLI